MARTAAEIREEFLRFFEQKGHQRVASSSLVPQADPTLMFVNAGMVPFKRTFLGEEPRPYTRAASSQKCMRVSGKHNDLENVGRTPRHHTFFEMLGNFSFGDYFKEQAIEFAWELVTQRLGIDEKRLVTSVYLDDDEAFDLWTRGIGLDESRVFRLGESENFWSMGDTGPCGPCSEIHLDFGVNANCSEAVCDPSCDCGRWFEIWNLVFMQFNRDAEGKQTLLPKPSIDTGAGLERLASVIQGVPTTWETDAFVPLIECAQELSGVSLGEDPEKDVSLRVVADHARALAFLIGDGVLPSNVGRGYVLRRILRRASRHGVLLGVERPFLFEVANRVIQEMGPAFPELVERRAFIEERIRRDEERFLETLTKGLAILEDEIEEAKAKSKRQLAGDVAFKLYDTYGFPLDLTEDILRGHQLGVDHSGFDASMEAQRARARAAWKGSGDAAIDEVYGRIAGDVSVEFRGYDATRGESTVSVLLVDGEPADDAGAGQEIELVVPETPFYAESGGQVGDRGVVIGPEGRLEVRDTQKPSGDLIVHRGIVTEGRIATGDPVTLEVDADLRQATVRNHSGTHLLHAALRAVLGPQAMQKGSLVGPDRLRFDFTHDSPLTAEEIAAIEDLSNEWIERNASAAKRVMSYREAIDSGAVAIFEEKYGDEVRVVSFGEFSTELCGGTHAGATGEIGFLKIVGETGIAAGVRRIEALTGLGALRYLREQERAFHEAARTLGVPPAELPTRVQKMLDERKEAQRELDGIKAKAQSATAGDLATGAKEIEGGKALAARVDGTDGKALRSMSDDLRNQIGSGVVFLVGEKDGKVLLAVGVTKDLVGRYNAGALIKELAPLVGGGGGGRPDFAQAGGKDPERIEAVLARFDELVGAS